MGRVYDASIVISEFDADREKCIADVLLAQRGMVTMRNLVTGSLHATGVVRLSGGQTEEEFEGELRDEIGAIAGKGAIVLVEFEIR